MPNRGNVLPSWRFGDSRQLSLASPENKAERNDCLIHFNPPYNNIYPTFDERFYPFNFDFCSYSPGTESPPIMVASKEYTVHGSQAPPWLSNSYAGDPRKSLPLSCTVALILNCA